MRRRRRFWARTTPVFRCMTERDVSMGLHRRFIKAAWSTAVEILRKVKRTWGCCTTAMEPRSPPPLWPVSNAFSTPWTPHPVDGPARRATTSFPSRRKGHVLGQPPPIVGPSTQPLDHANGLPTGPFQFDLHEGARLLTRHRVTGTYLHRQTVRQPEARSLRYRTSDPGH